MQKRVVAIFFIVFMMSLHIDTSAQVTIQFNTNVYGQSLEGLAYVKMVSSYPQLRYAKMRIKVRGVGNGLSLTVNTPYFALNPGHNSINRTVFSQSSLLFSNTREGLQLQQTGRMPEGEYEFCFELLLGNPKTGIVDDVVEECYSSVIQPLSPLMLVDPAPDDIFCNKRPSFTWQSPTPIQKDTRYRLVLCEKQDRQSDIEAINYNIPIISSMGIPGNNLFYPSKTPDLKTGRTYVWQVTAYQDQTVLTRSEIWTFTVQCEEGKITVAQDSYREAKEQLDGSIYYAYGKLRFSVSNPYAEGPLDYAIEPLYKKEKSIKKLPGLMLKTGYNQFEIDISEFKEFKDGKDYLLTLRLQMNKLLQLRFVYIEAE